MTGVDSRPESLLDQRDAVELLAGQNEVLELIAQGASRTVLLDCITKGLERLIPGSRCSVLVLDRAAGSLRHGSAPSLPAEYLAAIDGLVPGPGVGSCGAAAYLGVPVIADDIDTDRRWDAFRDSATAAGLRACWSTPIRGNAGAVVGTFAVYHQRPHAPTPREQRVVERLSYLAGVAIEHAAMLDAELARRSAEAASRAKSEFLSAMSHEMRTPLQAITGFVELLSTLPLDAARRDEALGHINAAARHLLELVDDTLDLARIEAGALPLTLRDVPVAGAVGEVLDLLAPLAAQHAVRLVLDDTDAVVVADDRRLRQVLINLVSNAISYGGSGGVVTVAAGRAGESVRITVTDNGPGIAPDLSERLFEPFYAPGVLRERAARRDDHPAPGADGIGLGLMVTRGLSEAMGGRLELAPADGGGTVATVTLRAGGRATR